MIFKTRKKANTQLILNESPVEKVNCTKFLGIIIDEELSWKYHINHSSTNVSNGYS